MKFIVDMPLSPDLAIWLEQQGHDAVHAFRVGLEQASDTVILEFARKEQRVVITADLDYPRILALTQAKGPGLILFRGGNYTDLSIFKPFFFLSILIFCRIKTQRIFKIIKPIKMRQEILSHLQNLPVFHCLRGKRAGEISSGLIILLFPENKIFSSKIFENSILNLHLNLLYSKVYILP